MIAIRADLLDFTGTPAWGRPGRPACAGGPTTGC
jgi:hypothetical protein